MANSMLEGSFPPAVVVGVCAHGLSVIRALAGHDFEIFALDSNSSLPGARTRLARFIKIKEDVNTLSLINALLYLHDQFWIGKQPVLFLTNDHMVRVVAENWQALDSRFLLSWSEKRDMILTMLDKSSHEKICSQKGLHYPTNVNIKSKNDIENAINIIGFPIIVKPSRPLSSFKVRLFNDREGFELLLKLNFADLPFLAQRWISGDDHAIYFSAIYLDNGRIIARFDGHKLRSRPMGHTTIAESFPNDEVFKITCRFFADSRLSGPVSLEVKRDDNGLFWVIEPTVGRTDFWIDTCIANGVNLPLIEYYHQIGRIAESTPQVDEYLWFNTERDPLGFIAYVFGYVATTRRNRRWCFPYLSKNDLHPFLSALYRGMLSLFRRSIAKIYYSVRRLRKTS